MTQPSIFMKIGDPFRNRERSSWIYYDRERSFLQKQDPCRGIPKSDRGIPKSDRFWNWNDLDELAEGEAIVLWEWDPKARGRNKKC